MLITEYIKNNITYLDGGMGTFLQSAGLKPGELPERWNLSHPDIITALHKMYFDAGSNIVLTNTFGANSLKFGDDELTDIVSVAVGNVRSAAAQTKTSAPQEKFIALDVGPLGRLLKPLGDLDFEEAVRIFSKTISIGAKCGADLIFIETMNDSYETKAALLAAKETCDLPVFVSNAYGEDGKLMTGASPAAMVAMLEGMGADAIGVNCSLGPKQLGGIIDEYLKYASVPVLVKPNAGLPRISDGKTVYDVLPEEFSDDIADFIKRGVHIAGGCCGTTPKFIRAVVQKCSELKAVPITEKNITFVSSYTHSVVFDKSPVLIGERINPTGKKKLKAALVEKDMDYILSEGIKQQERGVHILDVNVGLPEINETEMLTAAVSELQSVINLPLQIDSADPAAMEQALRIYNGKALINSVSGKEEIMKAVFPLAKKYGGVVIALTLDDDGIPETAEGRMAIAKKILAEAKKYGIEKKNIIFDPLAMTVSADPNSAKVTLECVRRIKTELGCHTSLGVSNVSFGLPSRSMINSTFFAMALNNGLSAAIMNPNSVEMLGVYYSFRALNALDENFTDYIQFTQDYDITPADASKAAPSGTNASAGSSASGVSSGSASDYGSELKNAIVKGLKEQAGKITAQLLETADPMVIVNDEIIPALDIVGEGYEKSRIYLPQLLMSAESAQAAFEKIRDAMKNSSAQAPAKCPFVIATVKGDIHDIGKNIVKLIMENYGFEVIDMGKDVPAEAIVDKVVELKAPLLGLSALMTTTVPAMEETIKLARKKAPWCKIIVGGAVLTQEYADMIGADKYAKDAMETVRYSEEVFGEINELSK
ncbi:MAG TPA: homocysteine S-methyltransferase family protein [Candidatus Alectryocaccobium stercorigallinarum]|nr:homocysteine S-methyltransferase family protein [Candidatus Alectryocaccobium stercorigallinarum]